MDNEGLVKITFPDFEQSGHRMRFYRDLNRQLDQAGYVFKKDYDYVWNDTGTYVPSYILVESEIALIFVLRYGCVRAA